MTTALFPIIDREQTQAGLFVTFEEPSREMELEATAAGFYTSAIDGRGRQLTSAQHARRLWARASRIEPNHHQRAADGGRSTRGATTMATLARNDQREGTGG